MKRRQKNKTMNPKIEVMKWRMITDEDLEKYRSALKQFAEAHKIANVSTTVSSTGNGASQMFVTILYEEVDKLGIHG
jgi:hypothetical protein